MKPEKAVIGEVPENVFGMFADLCLKMKKGVILPKHLAMFLQKQNPFIEFIKKDILLEWQEFYQKYFSMDLDFSKLQIPPEQEGFDRVIIIPKGITINQVYEACSKNFPCWRWRENLNEAVSHNDRSPEESYAIRVRDRQEADEENKNLSANEIKEMNVKGITLLERLIFELKYWDETKEHLDFSSFTLCAGSRYSDGHVPRVDWSDSCLNVSWCFPQSANSCCRARTVVSF